ncbi:MAG: hypothetical protein IT239_03795 [Bacteroidia bacterium]|nr:hypothetical protein [Bacteroidia bacterium]
MGKKNNVIFFFFLGVLFLFQNKIFANEVIKDTVLNKEKKIHDRLDNRCISEFGNAYTLPRHEIKLNVIGKSAYAFSNRTELSVYFPLFFILPNFSLKHKIIDKKFFVSSIEGGACGGVFPFSMASGIFLPGMALGVGTFGIFHGTDYHSKLYFSFPLSNKFTLSARYSISVIRVGYRGIVGGAAVTGNGIGGYISSVDIGKKRKWYGGAVEANYALDKKNYLSFTTSLGMFDGGAKGLGLSTLSWTHAKNHFHYSLGLYGFFDPPTYEMVKQSKLLASFFINVYWILNNGKPK